MSKPLVYIEAVVEEIGKIPRKMKKKVMTKPELETVNKDLFSVVKNMHEALLDIERAETLVFPLLKLDNPMLNAPDVHTNE